MKAPSSSLLYGSYFLRSICILFVLLFATACEIRNEPRARSSSRTIKEPAGAERPQTVEKKTTTTSVAEERRYESQDEQSEEEPAEIAIMLSPDLALDEVPTVMEQAAKDLARRFPGIDLTIVGYAPADPPMPVGRADFNSRTGQTSFKWELPKDEPKIDENLIQI